MKTKQGVVGSDNNREPPSSPRTFSMKGMDGRPQPRHFWWFLSKFISHHGNVSCFEQAMHGISSSTTVWYVYLMMVDFSSVSKLLRYPTIGLWWLGVAICSALNWSLILIRCLCAVRTLMYGRKKIAQEDVHNPSVWVEISKQVTVAR